MLKVHVLRQFYHVVEMVTDLPIQETKLPDDTDDIISNKIVSVFNIVFVQNSELNNDCIGKFPFPLSCPGG